MTTTRRRSYSIKEAAALTGLPASTLRYYESIGIIAPVGRDASSKHRSYDDADLDEIMWVACLAATGMSVADMRTYMANARLGDPAAAAEQAALLQVQRQHLEREAQRLAVRQRYVALKIDYWRAVEDGDSELADRLALEARALADELHQSRPD
jgi:DNA-binding transcriptional MerR regulator